MEGSCEGMCDARWSAEFFECATRHCGRSMNWADEAAEANENGLQKGWAADDNSASRSGILMMQEVRNESDADCCYCEQRSSRRDNHRRVEHSKPSCIRHSYAPFRQRVRTAGCVSPPTPLLDGSEHQTRSTKKVPSRCFSRSAAYGRRCRSVERVSQFNGCAANARAAVPHISAGPPPSSCKRLVSH